MSAVVGINGGTETITLFIYFKQLVMIRIVVIADGECRVNGTEKVSSTYGKNNHD